MFYNEQPCFAELLAKQEDEYLQKDRERNKRDSLNYTHCILCDVVFDKMKNNKFSQCTGPGYAGLVCRNCIRGPLRGRIREYKERAQKAKTYSNLKKVELFRVIVESAFICSYCGDVCNTLQNSKKQLTIDHIYPLSLGGMNIKENLSVLCKSCHHKKDKHVGNILKHIQKNMF